MKGAARWATAVWTAGVAAVIAVLPWAASGRLPGRLATHWSGTGGGTPDGSMPLWAASAVPALIWLVLTLVLPLTTTALRRRAGAGSRPATRTAPGTAPRTATPPTPHTATRPTTGTAGRPVSAVALLSGGVLLVGAQAAVIRANLDRTDWHEARLPAVWIVALLATALAAGAGAWLLTTRGQDPSPAVAPTPPLEIPDGQHLAWFSRATNPWLHGAALLTGLAAAASGAALAAGLVGTGPFFPVFAGAGLASCSLAACASVRVRVSEHGLEVAFGPLGRPRRRWAAGDIESARVEHRTPAQAGGWGYRLGGLGTTVMVRGGECLVVRLRGRRSEFAVSVDDAERGAALLNALRTPQPH
ncbi:DUF1648 domain-containing protein [Streptomyces sp. NPDC007971]|uniref:DUF1648 domain-containing protein n=1 Tax=Streptomyces sp. NPDC007971 TaxID=3364799 RepID=UPI0036E2E12A